ncbi:phage-shock protein [Candidatus Hydrogenedentota bacterium]
MGVFELLTVLGIVFLVIVAPFLVIGGAIIMALRILSGGSSRRSGNEAAGEARMIQEIHAGLTRMEERIESLETIVIDQDKKEGEK